MLLRIYKNSCCVMNLMFPISASNMLRIFHTACNIRTIIPIYSPMHFYLHDYNKIIFCHKINCDDAGIQSSS